MVIDKKQVEGFTNLNYCVHTKTCSCTRLQSKLNQMLLGKVTKMKKQKPRLLSFASVALCYLLVACVSGQCYSDINTPRVVNPTSDDKHTSFEAITANESLQALFVGGTTESDDLNDGNSDYLPIILRMDLAQNTWVWRKGFQVDNKLQIITGLSVDAAGTTLVAYGTEYADQYYEEGWLFTLRAADGHYLRQAIKIYHGPTKKGEYILRSEGMYHDPYGMVYLAWQFRGQDGSDSDDGSSFTNYAGKLAVGGYSAVTQTLDFYWHQSNYFGDARAIAYIDYGASGSNAYVGGRSDTCSVTSTGSKCWTISINRLKPTGLKESQTQIKVQSSYYTNVDEAPLIDHMHYQNDHSVAGDWLFGTTRGWKRDKRGKNVLVWRLDLDASGNPRADNLQVKQLDAGKFNKGSHVQAVYPKMNTDSVYLVYWHDDQYLYFLDFDFSSSQVTSSLYMKEVVDKPSSIFIGSATATYDSVAFKEAYTVGKSRKVEGVSNTGDFSKDTGVVWTSIRTNKSCQKDYSGSTVDISVTDYSSTATLEFIESEFATSLLGMTQTDVALESWDLVLDQFHEETWCNSYPSVTVNAPSTLSQICYALDDTMKTVAFTPATLDSCSDPANVINYQITNMQAPLDPSDVFVSFDATASTMQITGLSGGSSFMALKTVTATYSPPDSAYQNTFTFDLIISDCATMVYTPSGTQVNQVYYVTDPYADYTFPNFLESVTGCTTDLTNSISTNAFITGASDNGGVGSTVGWQTNDEAHVGTYTITITVAEATCTSGATASDTYTLEVRSMCWVTPLTIDSASSVFASPALTQDVWQPQSDLTWDDSFVTISDASVDCGVVEFSLVNTDGSSLDSAVFTQSLTASLGATQTLSVQTDDSAKVGTYNLRVSAWYTSYTTNVQTKDFSVVITDTCESPTLTAASLSDETYQINNGAQVTPSFADFLNSPSYCPINYSMSVSPALPTADPNAIVLDPVGRTYTFSSTDIASENTYTVTTTALTPGGADTGVSFDFDVQFIDPCGLATLTIDPTTLTASPYTYVIDAAADVQTFLDTKVSSSEVSASCPTDFVFSITNRDGSPIDSALFTWDSGAQTLSTSTSDFSYFTNSPYELTAHVAYAGAYSIAGTLDFDVIVDISCTSAVFDAFTISAMTHSVLGAADTQVIANVQDSVSKVAGNQNGYDHCGNRSFSITTTPSTYYSNYLSLDTSTDTLTLGLAGTTFSDIGSYTIEVTVTLDSYSSVIGTTTFTVDVTDCVVTALSMTSVASQSYNVYTPAITFSHVDFIQTPDCQYTLDYTYQIKDSVTSAYSALPSSLITESSKTFTVSTNDPSEVATYLISIIGATPASKPAYQDELIVTLDVANGCLIDEVTATGAAISDLTYYVNNDGALSWSPTWSSLVTGCPLTYEVGRIVSTVEQALTSHETAALTHYPSTDGHLELTSSDYALDGESWEIKLYQKSTYSTHANAEGVYSFTITFRDICWDSVLTAAVFSSATYSFDRMAAQTMPFAAMIDTDQGSACGGYTYELEYQASGPLYSGSAPDLSHYTFSGTPSLDGIVTALSWVGTHPFKLKCTNGVYDASASARGTNGLFTSVYSTQIDVTITEPCDSTVVNGDSAIFEWVLVVAEGSSTETIVENGPTDSVSLTYGNGYDVCGDLTYTLSGTNEYTDAFMTLTQTVNPGAVDTMTFDIVSDESGIFIPYEMTMSATLGDFPNSTPATFPVTFNYRVCAPTDLSFSLDTLSYEVEARSSYGVVDVSIDQAPCVYDQYYDMSIDGGLFGRNYPDFLDLSEDGLLSIYAPDIADQGVYTVTLRSYLDAMVTFETTQEIIITVIYTPKEVILWPIEAKLYLDDQVATVGQKFVYQLPQVFNWQGLQMRLELDLGLASAFAVYDASKNRLVAVDNLLRNEYVGRYRIGVTAILDEVDAPEEVSNSFSLEVLANPLSEEDEEELLQEPKEDKVGNLVYEPYQPIDQPTFIQRTTTELGPYDANQPVPRIKSLSNTGLLTITWNKAMTKPSNLDQLPETYVVVTDEEEADMIEETGKFVIEDDRSRRTRRLRKTREWFETEKQYLEYLLVMDALDIELIPGDEEDPEHLKFNWELVAYEQEDLQIQIYFDYPKEISESGTTDEISVTFWGTEFFQSQDGSQVRYGSNVSTSILRQVDPKMASKLETQAEIGMQILAGIVLVLMMLLVSSGSSLMSIWLFLTSLSLIAHSILLDVSLPDEAFVILKVMLKCLRVDFAVVHDYLDSNLHALQVEVDDSPEPAFELAGYIQTHFLPNMGYPLLAFLAIPFVLFLICLPCGLVCPERADRDDRRTDNLCKFLFNTFLRALCILLLETCICATLDLKSHFFDGLPRSTLESQIGLYASLGFLGLSALLFLLFFNLALHKDCCTKSEPKKKDEDLFGFVLNDKGDVKHMKAGMVDTDFLPKDVKEELQDVNSKQFKLNQQANLAIESLRRRPLQTKTATEDLFAKRTTEMQFKSVAERLADVETQMQLNMRPLQKRGTILEHVPEVPQSVEDFSASRKFEMSLPRSYDDSLPRLREKATPSPGYSSPIRIKEAQHFEGGSLISLALRKRQKTQHATKKALMLSFKSEAYQRVEHQWNQKPRTCCKTLFLDQWVTRSAIGYTLIHFLRCLAFAAGSVFLRSYPVMQILTYIVPSLMILALALRQKHNMWRHRLLFIQLVGNEITIYLSGYFLLLATPLQPDNEKIVQCLGRILLGLVGLNIVFNVLIMTVIACKSIRRCFRKGNPKSLNKVSPLLAVPTEEKSMTHASLLAVFKEINSEKASEHAQSSPSPRQDLDDQLSSQVGYSQEKLVIKSDLESTLKSGAKPLQLQVRDGVVDEDTLREVDEPTNAHILDSKEQIELSQQIDTLKQPSYFEREMQLVLDEEDDTGREVQENETYQEKAETNTPAIRIDEDEDNFMTLYKSRFSRYSDNKAQSQAPNRGGGYLEELEQKRDSKHSQWTEVKPAAEMLRVPKAVITKRLKLQQDLEQEAILKALQDQNMNGDQKGNESDFFKSEVQSHHSQRAHFEISLSKPTPQELTSANVAKCDIKADQKQARRQAIKHMADQLLISDDENEGPEEGSNFYSYANQFATAKESNFAREVRPRAQKRDYEQELPLGARKRKTSTSLQRAQFKRGALRNLEERKAQSEFNRNLGQPRNFKSDQKMPVVDLAQPKPSLSSGFESRKGIIRNQMIESSLRHPEPVTVRSKGSHSAERNFVTKLAGSLVLSQDREAFATLSDERSRQDNK